MNVTSKNIPVVIIGGGPVGLAAASHLEMKKVPFVLLEAGDTIGANISHWNHVRLFSPWKYNIDNAAQTLLQKHDWSIQDMNELHTGQQFLEQYLRPLSELPELKPYIFTNSKVVAIGRKGLDKVKTSHRETVPFIVNYERNGSLHKLEAKAIIDASGTWQNPNPIGSGGIYAEGEMGAQEQIFYGIPDVMGQHRSRYVNKKVLVVGSGHSAINAILDLNELKKESNNTSIVWALRKPSVSETYGGGNDDALPARGQLGIRLKQLVDKGHIQIYSPFFINKIERFNSLLTVGGQLNQEEVHIENIDEIIACTGSRPSFAFLREIRVDIDSALESVPALAELIDPNIHSCGTVRPHGEKELRQPEKNFYIVGSKSYGRAPTFLMATGYEQVRSVVAALTGDVESASKVELNLPATGVCQSNQQSSDNQLSDTNEEHSSVCCGCSMSMGNCMGVY